MGTLAGLIVFLQIVFFILKISGSLAWPWVWVLAPLWGGAILAGLIVLIVFIVVIIMFR